MGIQVSGEFDDTNSDLYEQEEISVGITEVEAICSSTDIDERESVRIYNKGSQKVYVGPSGVTASSGEPVFKNQWIDIPIKGQSVFMITASGTANVIVTDLG